MGLELFKEESYKYLKRKLYREREVQYTIDIGKDNDVGVCIINEGNFEASSIDGTKEEVLATLNELVELVKQL